MTKKKYKIFIDIVTVLLVLFPLIMSLVVARSSGNFDCLENITYFAISEDLTYSVVDAVLSMGVTLDGSFSLAAVTIFSNAIIIYLFRVMLSVALWLPKLAYNLINLNFEGDT